MKEVEVTLLKVKKVKNETSQGASDESDMNPRSFLSILYQDPFQSMESQFLTEVIGAGSN